MAKDPYRYFRVEARELHATLERGVLSLEKGGPDRGVVIKALLRAAHTLKGAARVVKQSAIADAAHALEEDLGRLVSDGTDAPVPVDPLLRTLDAIRAQLATLGAPGDVAAASAPTASATATQRAVVADAAPLSLLGPRIDASELDAIGLGLAETNAAIQSARQRLRAAESAEQSLARITQQLRGAPEVRGELEALGEQLEAMHREALLALARGERELDEVRELSERLRLTSLSVLWPSLERAVRDAGQLLDKPVELSVRGGEHRLDSALIGKLGEPLLHLVRNAVAHGIEARAARREARKREVGTITIDVVRAGARLVLTCRDDGKGIDVTAVASSAVAQGRLDAAEAARLDLPGAIALLLEGGVTTTASPDQTSGRGLGLGIVRAALAEIGGELRVESERGAGTHVVLDVPVSIAAMNVLRVEIGGQVVGLPLESVAEVRQGQVGTTLLWGAQSLSIVPLAAVLGVSHGMDRKASPLVVVVREPHGSAAAAVAVDRLIGVTNVVVRRLPKGAHARSTIAGAWLAAEGDPCLVVQSSQVIARVVAGDVSVEHAAAIAPPPLLVVDDSLTTRMLEQSILESAGYEVEVATSAEEALAMVRERAYGLLLVDVEMPGMDGFAFVATLRADETLRHIPAILVTSRNAPEDRQRGVAVGASAYVVKSEFDQEQLLATVRRLLAGVERG